jgi:hypothetical protein
MGCITSATFVILVNGEPSDFFSSGRGLRQGCPMSPLLFIIIMEGLSLELKRSHEASHITGIKLSCFIKILHLLFVDDILLMTSGTLEEWEEIRTILKLFCNTSGLQINSQKMTFFNYGVNLAMLDSLKLVFTFNIRKLTDGFYYLGFFMKIDRYLTNDWIWLVEKYENGIRHWCT